MLRVGQPPTAELTAYYMFAKPRLGVADEPAAVSVLQRALVRSCTEEWTQPVGRFFFVCFLTCSPSELSGRE